MRGNALWTDERIVLLKELWAEGATANLIAAQLGACRDPRSWERFFACAWATALRNRPQRRVQKLPRLTRPGHRRGVAAANEATRPSLSARQRKRWQEPA